MRSIATPEIVGAAPASLLQFLKNEVITDADDGRWSPDRHEPLIEPIALLDRVVTNRESNTKVTVVKAEQIGFTTFAIGFAVWLAAERGCNTGYFFPTDKDAGEFGMSKLNPMVNESDYLRELADDGEVNRGVLKQFRDKFLYIIGLNKIPTSRAMDFQISDEVDMTSSSMRKWKRGRMRHSQLRCELDFSAPYAQNSGIDKRFQEGSQRRYLVSCMSCGKSDICLEESFPECMREFNGKWIRVCPVCSRKLDLVANGAWVPTFPQRETEQRHYSYRISALSMLAVDGNEIMAAYNSAVDSGDPDEMAIFNRSVRAFADAGSMQPFDDATLRRLKQRHDYVLSTERVTNDVFLGGDAGNACWLWLQERMPDGRPRLIWAEKVHSDRFVERTAYLMNRFNVRFGVIDKKPLLTDSRKLAYMFPRRLALLDFSNGSELQLVEEQIVLEDTVGSARSETGPKYLCVKVDRNAALGQFCAASTHVDRGLILPGADTTRTMELVGEHLKKLQKVESEDSKGNVVHRFLDEVENHLGMAGMAAHLAQLVAPSNVPFVIHNITTDPRSWGAIQENKWSGFRGGR
jgi:hypothetical protein